MCGCVGVFCVCMCASVRGVYACLYVHVYIYIYNTFLQYLHHIYNHQRQCHDTVLINYVISLLFWY